MPEATVPRVCPVGLDANLDKPIYRIFPLWFFEQSLALKSLSLVPPSAWEDPFEDMCSRAMIIDRACKPWKQEQLASHLPPAYAQCWSYEHHSDALLRAYSRVVHDPIVGRNLDPRGEGVRVKTTPRLLLEAIKAWVEPRKDVHGYLGRVRYIPEADLSQEIANIVGKHGIAGMAEPDHRAKTLWLKRDFFRHEDEVRLICIGHGLPKNKDVFPLPIDLNTTFLEIQFDPRLKLFENRERQQRAKSLGYSGPFLETALYTKAFFDIVVDGALSVNLPK